MSKKFANVSEVVAVREANSSVLFNLTAALEAAEKMPVVSRSRESGTGALASRIIELLNAAGKVLSCSQIHAALIAGGMTEVNGKELTKKNICDKCWALEKAGKIVKSGLGCYGPKIKAETTTEKTVTE